jgi:16S rRNA (guanine966-N2)-methyltransferase
MRIVSGSRKGHRIDAPKGVVTRPTGDRVREAVFAIVGAVEGATVLDLFAGSGAMGLEALSRGAAHADFVERDGRACRVIAANAARLGLADATHVVRGDAVRALRDAVARGATYDLVLVDAPYEEWRPRLEALLGELLLDVLADEGLVVVESSSKVEPNLPLALVTSRRYGSARITVFSR